MRVCATSQPFTTKIQIFINSATAVMAFLPDGSWVEDLSDFFGQKRGHLILVITSVFFYKGCSLTVAENQTQRIFVRLRP